jgi:hypothetical protein
MAAHALGREQDGVERLADRIGEEPPEIGQLALPAAPLDQLRAEIFFQHR